MKVLGVLSLNMMRLKESTVMAAGFYHHKNEDKTFIFFWLKFNSTFVSMMPTDWLWLLQTKTQKYQ